MLIFERAMINDYDFFKNHDYDINITDELGKSLLHYAVLGSSFEVINELIRKGINIDILDNDNESAFFDCARKGKLEIAKLLIVNNSNINILNKLGESPFHLASSKGNKTFLKLLVENKVTINTKTNKGLYPVHYAILAGQIDIIKYILNLSNQSFLLLDNDGNSLLHYAAQTTNDLMIFYLISEGINPNLLNKQYETALFNAVKHGTKETINALLSNDSYIDIININNETPIDYCYIYERYSFETLLTNYKMLPKYERLTSKFKLTILTLNRQYNELNKYIKNNVIMRNDKYNYSALDYAVLYKFEEAIKILKKINKE